MQNYDFYLTIDSNDYGFLLAEQNGVELYNDGLAPFITPQFRTESFSYDHVPPEIEVPLAAESWEAGAGYDLSATGGNVSTNRYAYSRGLDLSHEGRIFISPKQQTALTSTGAAIAAAPVKFVQTSLGFFMLAGAYIYEYDASAVTTSKWIARDDASADGQAYKDMVELDGTLYAARGSAADYKYSTDGVTWTAFTDADQNADYFVTRGNGSDIAAVWKVLANLIRNSTDGKNGGVSWSGADEVGHTSETATGLIAVNNDIYAFKNTGIYVYDGTNTVDLWKTNYLLTGNGKNPYQWVNGKIYAPYGKRLLEIDAYSQDTTVTAVFPMDDTDTVEIKGDITAIGGDMYFMYLAVKNRAGNTYIMKGVPGKAWHTFLYLGANDCNALYIAPPGEIHSTNPCLVLGYGTAAPYYILTRENLNPDDDPVYRFDTTEGTVYGPYFNFGAKTYSKFLNRGAVLVNNASAGRPVTLAYEVDRGGTSTDLVDATSDGKTETDEDTTVEFFQLRYVLSMQTGDEAASPVVDSVSMYATLNPPRKRIWKPVIALSDTLTRTAGISTNGQPSATKLREILYGAVNKRITMKDQDGHTHTARLMDLNGTGRVAKSIGGKEHYAMGYQLTIVETQRVEAEGSTTAVYDTSTYDSGAVYS